jgi:hypothetical protein
MFPGPSLRCVTSILSGPYSESRKYYKLITELLKKGLSGLPFVLAFIKEIEGIGFSKAVDTIIDSSMV